MTFLTLFERTILEKLYTKSSTLNELRNELQIDPFIIFNTLKCLLSKDLIQFKKDYYQIHPQNKKGVYSLLKCPLNQTISINELIVSTANSAKEKKSNQFKFKKLKLNEEDYKVFKTMLANIESFLAESAKKNNNNQLNEKIVFWGIEDYSKLLNQISQRI